MSASVVPRRAVLAGLTLGVIRPDNSAAAVAGDPLEAALRAVGIAPDSVRWGDGIALTAPLIAEDGAAVPVLIRLAAGGTAQIIHLFAPANRRALVASLSPGEAAGRVEAGLRIRLARSQTVSAVARRADGTVVGARAEIQVTAGGGCRT
jgi:sulfur-oxidizing protein SoxY